MIAPAGSPGSPGPRASWARSFRDLSREHGFEPLRVEGTIPAGLEGTFYKNGAGLVGVGGERYGHWFDADGAVTGVRLQGGKAWGGVRLVRTPGLLRQERAGRRLFGGYNTPFKRPLREILPRGQEERGEHLGDDVAGPAPRPVRNRFPVRDRPRVARDARRARSRRGAGPGVLGAPARRAGAAGVLQLRPLERPGGARHRLRAALHGEAPARHETSSSPARR